MKLGLSGHVQRKNASLALQLAHAFLNPKHQHVSQVERTLPISALPFQIHLPDALGLARTIWPGRSQTLRLKDMTFYVDGAHTPESIGACVEWFIQSSSSTTSPKYKKKHLTNFRVLLIDSILEIEGKKFLYST